MKFYLNEIFYLTAKYLFYGEIALLVGSCIIAAIKGLLQ